MTSCLSDEAHEVDRRSHTLTQETVKNKIFRICINLQYALDQSSRLGHRKRALRTQNSRFSLASSSVCPLLRLVEKSMPPGLTLIDSHVAYPPQGDRIGHLKSTCAFTLAPRPSHRLALVPKAVLVAVLP
jgi:hypothetical protein